MIDIQNVSKVYKTKDRVVKGVDNVSLTLTKEKFSGLLVIPVQGKVH